MTTKVEIHPAYSNATQMWQKLQPYQRPRQDGEILTVPGSANLANLFCEAILDSKYGAFILELNVALRNTGYTTALFKVAQQDFVHKKYDKVYLLGTSTIAETAKAIGEAGLVQTDKAILVKEDDLATLDGITNSLVLVDNDVDTNATEFVGFVSNIIISNKVIQINNL